MGSINNNVYYCSVPQQLLPTATGGHLCSARTVRSGLRLEVLRQRDCRGQWPGERRDQAGLGLVCLKGRMTYSSILTSHITGR